MHKMPKTPPEDLVDKLPNGSDKDDLQERLDNLKPITSPNVNDADSNAPRHPRPKQRRCRLGRG